MIKYNTTFVCAPEDEGALIDYLRAVYIPRLMEKAALSHPELLRIEAAEASEEAVSLALGISAPSRDVLDQYLDAEGWLLQEALVAHFAGRVLTFSTTMTYVPL